MTPSLGGHVAALTLVVLDFAARSIRLRVLLRAVGTPIRPWDSVTINAWSDLGCALTPLRLGGEPARLMGLRMARIPVGPALTALGLEAGTVALVTLGIGLLLAMTFGGVWWDTGGTAAFRGLGWYLAAALIGAVGLALWLRRRSAPTPRPARPHTCRAIAISACCAAVSVGCRVAVLLALLWDQFPDVSPGTVVVGSFILIYGQLLTPTPSGVGLIDAAFLGGAAGPASLGLLLAWRAHTSFAGAFFGGVLLLGRLPDLWPGLRRTLGSLRQRHARDGTVMIDQAVEDRPPRPGERGVPGPSREPGPELRIG